MSSNNILRLLILGIFVSSCASTKKARTQTIPTQEETKYTTPHLLLPVSTPDQITGKRWELEWLKDIDIAAVDYSGNIPFAVFNTEKLTVSGNTGCNGFGGTIEIEDGKIKISMLYATKKFCMKIPEPEFLRNLEQCDKYVVQKQILKLYKGNDLLLEMIEAPQR
ncbi:MAG: META domain-containing protein [Breznakibacter sp.]